MGELLAIMLSFLINTSKDVNTINTKYETAKVQEYNDDKEEEKVTYNAVVKAHKNIPRYYSEELLCSLADTTWNIDAHNELLNSLSGNIIIVYGTVYSVKSNIDGDYIVFKQKRADSTLDGWSVITCMVYNKDEKERMFELKKGDKISVVGRVDKYFVLGVTMHDCYIK